MSPGNLATRAQGRQNQGTELFVYEFAVRIKVIQPSFAQDDEGMQDLPEDHYAPHLQRRWIASHGLRALSRAGHGVRADERLASRLLPDWRTDERLSHSAAH